MTQLKAKFRIGLDAFAKKHFGDSLGKLGDVPRTDATTLFYVSEIRNILHPGALPTEIDDLKECITDNKSDRHVDFIHRSDDGTVLLIQTKYRSEGKTEALSQFEPFKKCLCDLCPETRPTHVTVNQKVLDAISDIDWENDNFIMIFLSLGKKSDEIVASAAGGPPSIANSPLSDVMDRAEIIYLWEDQLNIEYRDALSFSTRETNPSIDLLLSNDAVAEGRDYLIFKNSEGVQSFLGVIDAKQIHDLYNRNGYRSRLFNLNIRNYIGDTRTNKDVIKTALDEASSFFFYNNGISAVATKIIPTKLGSGRTKLYCEHFSVINGAQTFRSIDKAFSQDQTKVQNLRVLIRITQLNFLSDPKLGSKLDKITKYNNTQNSMKISDFRSNDVVQLSIRNFIESEISAYKGQKYIYQNKRIDASKRNVHLIKMDEFCRAIYAFKFGPIDAHGGLSHLYDTSKDGGYTKLFGDSSNALTKDDLKELFGIWLICATAGETLGEQKRNAKTDAEQKRAKALERKFILFYAMGVALNEACSLATISHSYVLQSYSNTSWQEDGKRKKFVNDLFDVAADIVVQAYSERVLSGAQIHRNFFRDGASLTAIKQALLSRARDLRALSEAVKSVAPKMK